MRKKVAVGFEYDFGKGKVFLARKRRGFGKVALFDSVKEAREWVDKGQDLDASVFDVTYIKVPGR